MALIQCYDCGKEISSLATACPSCGAPPKPTALPPPLPARASRVKKLSLGTLALLTGALLVLVIRGVTNQANTRSVATTSPTPANGQSTTTSSQPVEAAAQTSTTPNSTRTRVEEATTTSSPAGETAAQSSTTRNSVQAPTEELTTTSSPAVEAAAQSSTTRNTAQTPTEEATTTSSQAVETAAQSSPSLTATENQNVSDISEPTAPASRATYQVIGIPVTDSLNVREGAGADYQVVTKLEPGTGGILLGTKRVSKGGTTWQEITVHGQTGWVNAAYLGLETQSLSSPTEPSTP